LAIGAKSARVGNPSRDGIPCHIVLQHIRPDLAPSPQSHLQGYGPRDIQPRSRERVGQGTFSMRKSRPSGPDILLSCRVKSCWKWISRCFWRAV